jgi:pimeloyl-ACP methyl ester carboxylesterase
MSDSEDIRPFRIDIPQADLDELHRRLDATWWPDDLPGAGWDYGVDADHLRDLVRYWRHDFDWRAQERRLNALPQFTTGIDGQDIHLLHVRSPEPDAIPLVMTHGWPSTVADFLDVIGPLTDPRAHGAEGAPAFHVVAPSVPGFAFTGPTRERGWNLSRIARAWAELMRRLGYDRYVAQGGDFGSMLSPELGRVDREHVMGVHVNALVMAVDWQSEDPTAGLTEEEIARVSAWDAEWAERSGYATVHSTRPHTIGYALTDSPVGMLAWNLEWFVDYDPTKSALVPVDRDAILTDATIFWLTRTSASAARLYKEAGDGFYGGERTDVPTAVAVFPGDITLRAVAERSNNVVRWTEYDRGGHFASLQAPDLLVDDIRAFTADLRRAG